MINTTLLVGRLGKNPELKYFSSGSVVAKSTLAVSRGKDETDWFDIEAWGKTAEIIGNYAKKGDRLGLEGSLKLDSWTDRTTGEARCKPVISVSRVELLSDKKKGSDDYGDE